MNWELLKYLTREDFKYPDEVNPEVIFGVDTLADEFGVKPVVLSDYRPGDQGTHGDGDAIDHTWPGVNPIRVNTRALRLRVFSGIGIYINEKGVVSHHCDCRPDRTVDNPARWGGIITHPAGFKHIQYVTMERVLDEILKKESEAYMSIFSKAGWLLGIFKVGISVFNLFKGSGEQKPSLTELLPFALTQLIPAVDNAIKYQGLASKEQFDQWLVTLDATTGSDPGAFDFMKSMPPEIEEEMFDALINVARIYGYNRLKVEGYYV